MRKTGVTVQWEGETLHAATNIHCSTDVVACRFFTADGGCGKPHNRNTALDCSTPPRQFIIWLKETDYVAATLSGLLHESSEET